MPEMYEVKYFFDSIDKDKDIIVPVHLNVQVILLFQHDHQNFLHFQFLFRAVRRDTSLCM